MNRVYVRCRDDGEIEAFHRNAGEMEHPAFPIEVPELLRGGLVANPKRYLVVEGEVREKTTVKLSLLTDKPYVLVGEEFEIAVSGLRPGEECPVKLGPKMATIATYEAPIKAVMHAAGFIDVEPTGPFWGNGVRVVARSEPLPEVPVDVE